MDIHKAIDRLKAIASTEEARLTAEILEYIVSTSQPKQSRDSRQESADRFGIQIDVSGRKD